jgi:hypothetical protein
LARRPAARHKLLKIGTFPLNPTDAGLAAILPSVSCMECRIQVLDERGVRTVHVAGQLGHAHVPDLLVACGKVWAILRIDLRDVLSADLMAVEALRRLRDGGARLEGVPRYIQLKLESEDNLRRDQ